MSSATDGRSNPRKSLQYVHYHERGGRKLTRRSNLHRSIVTIYVGPDHYPFLLHKGRLCQHSAFFEKAFHGSFDEASTGSMYMEEDGVDEFQLFEEWLYTDELNYAEDSSDPSHLLVKVFCLAEKVGIPELQNATLDTIRERAIRQNVHPAIPSPTFGGFGSGSSKPPVVKSQAFAGSATDPNSKYLPLATFDAIHHAYQNTPEASPLRKLLADIFAFNVKPDMLEESLLMLPAEFLADVLVINMRRLPLRLMGEKADFDSSADKYHIHDTHTDRKPRVFQGLSDEPNESPTVDEDNDWACFGASNISSSRTKKKKKGNQNSTWS